MMFGWLFGVILLLVVVWYFSHDRFNIPANREKKDTARDVLDKRYARGEITKEEYEEQKRILGN